MNFTDLRIVKTQERLQNALLQLLETKELKAVTIKEICEKAGISRNAFYQHYNYKEDLYDQMVALATEKILNALAPAISSISELTEESVTLYARQIINGISEVKELLAIMLKNDEGIFLKQFTDLIFGQILTQAFSFYGISDSKELRLYYEFLSAGIASFIIHWILDGSISKETATTLLADILQNITTTIPSQ